MPLDAIVRESKHVVLRAGREKSLRHLHPWIFSGGVEKVEGDPGLGETVAIMAHDGAFLAWAAYCEASQIRARVWSFDAADRIDEDFLRARIERAVERRKTLGMRGNAMRLVHGESDGLPGLIADRYGDTIVVQILSAGAERWRAHWAPLLMAATGAHGVYERSDVEVRTLEGLGPRTGALAGAVPERARIEEEGVLYEVDVVHGQKTGFYLDQRDNRALAASLAAGREVMNAFCYTGGFSLSALKAGAARVTSIDTSEEALAMARSNVEINGLDASRAEWLAVDVFAQLRKFRDQGR